MVGRELGGPRRQAGLAIIIAGAVLVSMAAYGIVWSGEARWQLVSACLALPGGLLAILAGCEVRTRAGQQSHPARPVVSMEEWLGRAASRAQAAKAASN